MNKRKPTLTIGIPAYNEEFTIGKLLKSIIKQNKSQYKLENVLVVVDGSKDNTAKIARSFRSELNITVVNRKKRSGKANALNYIYGHSKTDYLMTIDADVYFKEKNAIDIMIQAIKNNKSLNLVGPRHYPIVTETIFGGFSYMSYLILERAFLKYKRGNNFFSVMCVELMPKSFVDSFRFPKNTISDQCYVYAKATERNRKAFRLIKEVGVYFQPVSTFHDWRVLSGRSIVADKADVTMRFGDQVLNNYKLPWDLYLKSHFYWLIRSPFLTLGSLTMNIYIRVFPYKDSQPINGIWELTESSKQLIS